MKSIIITFVASFIILTSLRGQWEIVNEGIGYEFTVNIDFINNDTGWIAGPYDINKTKDGGKNWISLNNNSDLNFKLVDFINDSLGWAIGGSFDDYTIFRTLDGGKNWIKQKNLNYYWNTLYVVTENVVYVAGYGILKTSDGGQTWIDISPDNTKFASFNSVCFLNTDTGIVAGAYNIYDKNSSWIFFRTFNGGETWDKKNIPEFDEIFNVKFIDDSTGYFLAYVWDSLYLNRTFFICKTTDAFSTWSVLAENNYRIHSCHFFNNDDIISIMEDNNATNIMKSKDGGLTWENTGNIPPTRGCSYEIYFNAEKVGYIFGKGRRFMLLPNVIMKSVDQGNNWTNLKLTYPFRDVCFLNKDTGFVVGGCEYRRHFTYGDVFKTNNGGKTWNIVISEDWLSSCIFTNNSNGFVTSSWAGLWQTVNGGDSWVKNKHNFAPNDLFFINDTIGWACGSYDTIIQRGIFHTQDGSKSWEIKFDCNTCELNSIFFIDESAGWTVGESGVIFKYTKNNGWESIASGTDLPLNKVFFTDSKTGWIAGGYDLHPILLKTEDGGESWLKIENINYLINDFYFFDKNHGFAVGGYGCCRGVILETNDGGNNWTVQVDSLSAQLNAIHFKGGYGWAVGNNGLILKTIDSTYTSITEHYNSDNTDNILLYNYPNPFISSTIISYQLPSTADVELSVYNLLGQKVTNLVKERQQPGSYEVEWNAKRMKPSIYWCELKTGQNRKVMKMILLRE